MRPTTQITSSDTIFNESAQEPTHLVYQTPPQKRTLTQIATANEGSASKNLTNIFKQIKINRFSKSSLNNPTQVKQLKGDHLTSIADTEKKNPYYTDPPQKGKQCNCKKTKCLKLYCDCFASGQLCGIDCSCQGCSNNHSHIQQRNKVVESILERNSDAFNGKIVKKTNSKSHIKGCNCRKSGCQKKYCECFGAGAKCNELCKCEDCRNMDSDTMNSSRMRQVQKLIGSQPNFFNNENTFIFVAPSKDLLQKLQEMNQAQVRSEPALEKKIKIEKQE